jgi:hypothetical protein
MKRGLNMIQQYGKQEEKAFTYLNLANCLSLANKKK